MTIRSPEQSTIETQISVTPEALNYTVFVIQVTNVEQRQIVDTGLELLEQYNNETVTYKEYISLYQIFVQSTIDESATYHVNSSELLTWQFTSINEDLFLVFGLYKWDLELSFSNHFRFTQNWVISRIKSYQIGLVISIISMTITLTTVLLTYHKRE